MRVLCCLGVAIVMLGCATPEQSPQHPNRTVVRVELLAFSGRENPRWDLTEAEVAELIRRIGELSPGPAPPEPPGLGYSGLLITTSGREAGLPETMTVYRGVRLGPPGHGASRRDDGGLEQWLLEVARQRNYGEVLDILGL